MDDSPSTQFEPQRYDPQTGAPVYPQPRFDTVTGRPLPNAPRFDAYTGQRLNLSPTTFIAKPRPSGGWMATQAAWAALVLLVIIAGFFEPGSKVDLVLGAVLIYIVIAGVFAGISYGYRRWRRLP